MNCLFRLFLIVSALVALLMVSAIWRSAERAAPMGFAAPIVSGISEADLQTLLRDVYRVEKCRFIQPDLLWVTLPPDREPQATCQAIANVWAHRSGLPYVRVESWAGNRRLAQATVQNGRIQTP